MADVATLGLVAKYDSITDATSALDDLGSAAAGAEKGADKFKKEAANTNKETGKLTGGIKTLGGALDKAASAALGGGKQINIFGNLSKGALAAVSAGVAAVTLAMIVGIRSTLNYAEALKNTANMLGINTTYLQEMRFAAERAGIATSNFDVALRRFIRRSSEAARGTGAAKDAFKELGISLKTTGGQLKDSEVLLAEVADKLRGVEDPATKLRLAFKMFDTDGAAMLNLLNSGAEGMEKMREEARSLGIVLSEDLINASAAIKDNFALVGYAMQGLGATMTTVFAPVLIVVSQALAAIARGFATLVSYLPVVTEYATVAAASIGLIASPIILSAIGSLIYALGVGVVGAIRGITAAMLANPIGLLVAGFVTAVLAAYHFRDEIKKAIGLDLIGIIKDAANFIINSFHAAYEDIKFVFSNLPSIIGAAVIGAANAVIGAVELMLQASAASLNTFIDLANSLGANISRVEVSLPRLDNPSFTALAAENKKHASTIKEIMSQDPIGALGQAFDSATSKAAAFNGELTTLNDKLKETGGGGKDGAESAADKARIELETRLQTLREHFMSEQEVLAQQRLEHLETLDLARQAEMLSQQEYNDYKLMVEKEYQQQLQQIKLQEFASALDATGDFFGAMSSLQEGGNEKMLKAQRIFAAASALVNTYMAASQVLADPKLGFFAKFAAVASVIAKGVALVGAIKSGSSSASGGGGSNAPSAAPPEQQRPQQQAVELRMQGEVFSRETVADLIDKINDLGQDGYNVIVRTS